MNMSENLPTVEQLQNALWADIRFHRNKLLKEVDIKVNLLEDSGQDASNWRSYRQALRDLPQQVESPLDVVWPTKPQ